MDLNIVNAKGASAGNVDVPEVVFGRDFNETLVHQVVTAYLAGARAGTHAQKTRSRCAAAAPSRSGRKAPAVPVPGLFAAHCGAVAVRPSPR